MVRTTAGWLEKKEVVEVWFDPAITDFAALLAAARCVKDPSTVFVTRKEDLEVARKVVGDGAQRSQASPRPAKDADQKYYLRQTPYRWLPLTEVQAARLNGLFGAKDRDVHPESLLSPDQRRWLAALREAQEDKAKLTALRALRPARDPAGFAAYAASLARVLDR